MVLETLIGNVPQNLQNLNTAFQFIFVYYYYLSAREVTIISRQPECPFKGLGVGSMAYTDNPEAENIKSKGNMTLPKLTTWPEMEDTGNKREHVHEIEGRDPDRNKKKSR